MSRASDFGSLTQEVAGAYETRVKVLGDLAIDTKKMLEGFRKENRERTKEVSELLKDFDNAHAEMSAQLKADLARDEAERVEQTRAEIKQRVAEVSTLLKDFDEAHAAMSANLKADLARDEAERVEQTRAEIKQRMEEVSTLLKDFDNAHAAMSAQLKAGLAKDEAERVAQAQIEIKERVGAVTDLLDDFRKEREEAATAWQNLVSTMEGVRGGKKAPPPKAKVRVAPPPAEEVTEEEAVAEAEAIKVKPEAAELQQRVFEYLADHPDGIKMVEMEREFGIARIQMARILKNLMDDNKVEKRELLYFAI